MKILITGGSGQLGTAFRDLATQYQNIEFLFTSHQNLDITNESQVVEYFKQNQIDYLINCAAYTAVDKAEEETKAALNTNAYAVGHLATQAQLHNFQFIHISTDYVYGGAVNTPIKEDQSTYPEGIYGKSKLLGEKLALENNPTCMIIRTAWVYGFVGKNFVKTMLRLGEQRDHLKVVYDQIGSPTFTHDLAQAILSIIRQNPNLQIGGIYHYSNEGVTSWYDFAKAIFDLQGISCVVSPIESKDYPTPAKRPHYSVLNKEKIKKTFGIEIPHWRDSLVKYLSELKLKEKNSSGILH